MEEIKQMLASLQREFYNIDQSISELSEDTKSKLEIVTAAEGLSNAISELECALDSSKEEDEEEV